VAGLTDQQRELVRAHRTEVEALRNDYGSWVHVANATEAVRHPPPQKRFGGSVPDGLG